MSPSLNGGEQEKPFPFLVSDDDEEEAGRDSPDDPIPATTYIYPRESREGEQEIYGEACEGKWRMSLTPSPVTDDSVCQPPSEEGKGMVMENREAYSIEGGCKYYYLNDSNK